VQEEGGEEECHRQDSLGAASQQEPVTSHE
jgi:hypothetical protein